MREQWTIRHYTDHPIPPFFWPLALTLYTLALIGVTLAIILTKPDPPDPPQSVTTMSWHTDNAAARSGTRTDPPGPRHPNPAPKAAGPLHPVKTLPAPSAPPGDLDSPVGPTLACIREHESGGSYTIVNSLGYAGAYQLSPEYKDDWARRYGYGQWADVPVPQWPPSVQDAVALALGQDTGWHAWSNWAPYDCGWTQ